MEEKELIRIDEDDGIKYVKSRKDGKWYQTDECDMSHEKGLM